VEAAVDQRRRQMSELKVRVRGAENRVTSLRERVEAGDVEQRRLEQELNNAKEQQQNMLVTSTNQ